MSDEERRATTSLSFDPSGTRGLADLRPLARLPALRVLKVALVPGLVDLSPLASLTALEELDLVGCKRLADLDPLRGLPALRSLIIKGCGVTDLGVLRGLATLRHLGVSGQVDETPVDLAPLGALRELRSLEITELQGESISFLSSLGALEFLWLVTSDPVGGQRVDLAPLAALDRLEKLLLHGVRVPDVRPLGTLRNLRTLRLQVCETMFDGALFGGLPLLEALSLDGDDPSVLRSFAGMEGLSRLKDLMVRPMGFKNISPLASLRALERLELVGCEPDGPLTDLRPLASLAELRDLSITQMLLEDVGPLSGLAKLEEVDLSRTQIRSVAPLAGLHELQRLRVEDCVHLESIVPLRSCEKLVRLDCDGCRGLQGPETLEELRTWQQPSPPPPPRPARTYRSAGVVPSRVGELAVLDARNHLPRFPPEGWSLPHRSRDLEHCYAFDAAGVRMQLSLSPREESPYVLVYLAPLRVQKVTDDMVGGILRYVRQCEDFVEVDREDYDDILPPDLPLVRAFVARARRGSPDSWGAVRREAAALRVQASEPAGAEQRAGEGGELDVRSHLPDPMPEDWTVQPAHEDADVLCRIHAPGTYVGVQLVTREGRDYVELVVGFIPQDKPAYVSDDRAHEWLRLFRRHGEFRENVSGPFAEAPGMRVFVARAR